jgi:hypothetical protein
LIISFRFSLTPLAFICCHYAAIIAAFRWCWLMIFAISIFFIGWWHFHFRWYLAFTPFSILHCHFRHYAFHFHCH